MGTLEYVASAATSTFAYAHLDSASIVFGVFSDLRIIPA
jgi:hypothetical protein